MELRNSETLRNLTRAFGGECQDGAMYQYMADEATNLKQSYVSTILKQLATNEMAHAKVFYDYIAQNADEQGLMVEIKATYPMQHAELPEMLRVKSDNEKRQAQTVYPAFAKTANKEGFTDIAERWEEIAKIEARHASILKELYDRMSNNTLYSCSEDNIWKCTNCGYEQIAKKAWKKCPLCTKNQGMAKINLCGNNEDCGCVSHSIKKSRKKQD